MILQKIAMPVDHDIIGKGNDVMQITKTKFCDVSILTFERRSDARGLTEIVFDHAQMINRGIRFDLKEQRSYHAPKKGTFYGIHFQSKKYPQSKIIHLLSGRGIDYIIDLRKESPTFTQWIAIELAADDNQHIYIPQGYGHAFLSMQDNTTMLFSVNEPFKEGESKQIRFDDTQIRLEIPIKITAMADYDRNAPYLDEIELEV